MSLSLVASSTVGREVDTLALGVVTLEEAVFLEVEVKVFLVGAFLSLVLGLAFGIGMYFTRNDWRRPEVKVGVGGRDDCEQGAIKELMELANEVGKLTTESVELWRSDVILIVCFESGDLVFDGGKLRFNT